MRPLDAVRWTGAHWFVPVIFAVGVLVGLTEAAYPVDYESANLASASVSVTLTGPLKAPPTWQFGSTCFPSSLWKSAVQERTVEPTRLVVAHHSRNAGGCEAAVCVAARTAPTDTAGFQIVGIVFLSAPPATLWLC